MTIEKFANVLISLPTAVCLAGISTRSTKNVLFRTSVFPQEGLLKVFRAQMLEQNQQRLNRLDDHLEIRSAAASALTEIWSVI